MMHRTLVVVMCCPSFSKIGMTKAAVLPLPKTPLDLNNEAYQF